jgi:hypothetical protein
MKGTFSQSVFALLLNYHRRADRLDTKVILMDFDMSDYRGKQTDTPQTVRNIYGGLIISLR